MSLTRLNAREKAFVKELYESGLPVDKITKELYRNGIRNTVGKAFNGGQISVFCVKHLGCHPRAMTKRMAKIVKKRDRAGTHSPVTVTHVTGSPVPPTEAVYRPTVTHSVPTQATTDGILREVIFSNIPPQTVVQIARSILSAPTGV